MYSYEYQYGLAIAVDYNYYCLLMFHLYVDKELTMFFCACCQSDQIVQQLAIGLASYSP